LQIWTKTGNKDHTKPFDTYLNWLQQEEAPIYLLAVLGAVWSLLRRAPHRFAVFAGAWAFGLLVAYSIVPYKTPWLALNFIVPMAIIGGYALNEMYEWSGGAQHWRALTLALASAAVVVCMYQTIALNFFHYDDDSYPYVYAHTKREYLQLVNEVERLTVRAGTGRQTPIAIASPDYWPSPWYFRDYQGVGYQTELRAFTEPIVIAKDVQETTLDALLAPTHERVGTIYPLRPGVNLILYARRDLVKR
jgi:predicted membrane-bound mannosyltransferase